MENTPYRYSDPAALVGDDPAKNTVEVLDVLVIPQATGTLSITYLRNGEQQSQTVSLPMNQNVTAWAAGQSYNYTLLVKVDAITFSGITADAWGESYSGGDINIGQ